MTDRLTTANPAPPVAADDVERVDGGGVPLHRVHEAATVAVSDRTAFFPALDGVRAVAVIGVLLFHSEFTWAQGGFLGVSTFFTLSGFLITRLLLMEARDTGAIDGRRFFARRARRLLPAGMLGILLAAAVVLFDDQLVTAAGVGWDLLAAQLSVANWRFALSGQSYADLFSTPSPVLHYWSLAIEEQFYLGLIVLLLISVRLSRRTSRQVIPWMLLGLTVVLMIVSFTIRKTVDRAYYGTDTRGLEFMTGALLALVLVNWSQVRERLSLPSFVTRNARPALALLSVLALQAMIVCWVVVEQTNKVLYNGGLLAFSLVSATVIGACLVEDSPVAWMLSFRPLRYLGQISYGVYVFHWPLFLVLTEARLGFGGAGLFAVRCAATLCIAALSYHLVEVPVREARAPWARGAPLVRVAAIAGLVIVLSSSVLVGVTREPDLLAGDVGEVVRLESGSSADLVGTGGATLAPVTPASEPHDAPQPPEPPPIPIPAMVDPSRPLRVLVVGDSTALYLTKGLMNWAEDTGTMQVASHASYGCGILRADRVIGREKAQRMPASCHRWDEDWKTEIERLRPDVVFVASTLWDANDQVLSDGSIVIPGDAGYAAFASAEYADALEVLHDRGAVVLWARNPPLDLEKWRGADPERMEAMNVVLAELAAERPWMELVEYDDYVSAWMAEPDRGPLMRDGLHVSPRNMNAVGHWLGPVLLSKFWDLQDR